MSVMESPDLETKLSDPNHQQPKMNQYGTPQTNVHILNKKELENIPESEKQALLKMPVEEGCIWFGEKTSTGTEYWFTDLDRITKSAPQFHSMLEVIAPTGVSHLVVGGFKFQISRTNKNRINRGKFEQKPQYKPGQSSGYKPNPPKPVSDILIGPSEEVNDFIHLPENKDKWILFGDWKINQMDGKAYVGISKVSNTAAQQQQSAVGGS